MNWIFPQRVEASKARVEGVLTASNVFLCDQGHGIEKQSKIDVLLGRTSWLKPFISSPRWFAKISLKFILSISHVTISTLSADVVMHLMNHGICYLALLFIFSYLNSSFLLSACSAIWPCAWKNGILISVTTEKGANMRRYLPRIGTNFSKW